MYYMPLDAKVTNDNVNVKSVESTFACGSRLVFRQNTCSDASLMILGGQFQNPPKFTTTENELSLKPVPVQC